MIAVGEGNAGHCGAARRRGDARNDLDAHTLLAKEFQLLAAAPEHHGIAAFEAHHAQARARPRRHESVDFLLASAMTALGLAYVKALGIAPRIVEDASRTSCPRTRLRLCLVIWRISRRSETVMPGYRPTK